MLLLALSLILSLFMKHFRYLSVFYLDYSLTRMLMHTKCMRCYQMIMCYKFTFTYFTLLIYKLTS